MKKLFVMAMAVLAISFASCSESAQKNDDIAAVVENLQSKLDAGDASALQSALESAQAKISELVAKDPETAKTYVTKVQDFLKENSEKVQALVGDNAVAQTIVTTLVNAPAETVIQTLTAGQSIIDNAKQTAGDAQDAIEGALQEKADEVEGAVNAKIEEGTAKVNEKVEEAQDKVNQKVEEAKDKVNEKINEGADKLLKGAGLK